MHRLHRLVYACQMETQQNLKIMTDLDRLLGKFRKVAEGGEVERPTGTFTTYAITNFRGGLGNRTFLFNLDRGIFRKKKTLTLDSSPPCNFSQYIFAEVLPIRA